MSTTVRPSTDKHQMVSVNRWTDLDDLHRDVLLDELAGLQPECLGDLLDIASTIEGVR